jgi:hypothetical protein
LEVEMSENLAEQVIRPTYEQIVGSIRHSGVQELLRRAQEDERRMDRELERIEADEDLNDEARQRRAQELIDRYSPKISEAYRSAKEKVEASAENSYRFSLPFPEGKTFAQARAKDATELLAIQSEAEAISQRIAGKSLQEATKAVSRNPADRGIGQTASRTADALRKEFDRAMSDGGIEGRVRAMAVQRVYDSLGVPLDQVVDHHRTDTHRRALEDARRFEQAAFALPSGKKPRQNPFGARRSSVGRLGTYSSTKKAVVGGGRPQPFQKKNRRRAWK